MGEGVEMAAKESTPILDNKQVMQVQSSHDAKTDDPQSRRSTIGKIRSGWREHFNCCNILRKMFEIHLMAFLLFIFAGGVVYFQFAYPLRSWHALFICNELGDNTFKEGDTQMPEYMPLKDTYVFLFNAEEAVETQNACLAAGGEIATDANPDGCKKICQDNESMMWIHRWIFGIYDCVASTCAMTMPIFMVGTLWGWDHLTKNPKYIWLWVLWLFTNLVGWTTRDLFVYPFGRLWFYLSDFIMGPPMVLVFNTIYSKWIDTDTRNGKLGKQYANDGQRRASQPDAPFHPKFCALKMLGITTRNGTAMFMTCFAWLGVIGVYLFGLTVLFSFPCMHPMAQIGVLMVHYASAGGAMTFCFKSSVLYTNALSDRTLTVSFIGVLMWLTLAERFMLLDIPLNWLAPFLFVGLIAKIYLKVKQDEPSRKIDPLLGVHPTMIKNARFKNMVGDKEYMTMVCEMCGLLLAAIVRVCIYRFWTDLYKPAEFWDKARCTKMCEDARSKTRCSWKEGTFQNEAGEDYTKEYCDIGAYACLKADKYNEWIGSETDGYCVMKQEVEWECDVAAGINHCYAGLLKNIGVQYAIELVEMFLLCTAYHKRIRTIGKYWWQMVLGYIYILLFFGLHFFYNYYFKLQQEMGVQVTNVFGIGNNFDPSTCPAY